MPAADGTPTIWEKIGAVFNLEGAENATILAGDQRDLTQAEQDVLALFKPILSSAESTGLSDLTSMLQGILTLVPGVSTVSGAVQIVTSVLAGEAGPLAAQAKALGQTSLTTLVSAALAALGKVNLPVS
jgi:hypothetical protein